MSMASLRSRVEDVRRSDAAKNTLLNNLLNNVESLRAELEKSQAAARHYFDAMDSAKSELRELQTATDCDKFVLVTIDGDSMPFLDDFVSKASDGGVEAGRRLRTAIEDYHRSTTFYHPDDRILVQVFANLRGLAKACHQANITRQESQVIDFAAGFGSSHPLTNFIDAGSHKEAADSKMRSHLELFYRNKHCKHIIFGGSDNGYAGFLDQYAKVDHVNNRITILHEAHVPFWLAKTMKQFPSTVLANVFRTSKIQTNSPSGNGTPTAGTKRPLADAIYPQRRPSPPRYSGGLTVASKPNGTSQPSEMTVVDTCRPSVVYTNRYGQRLDSPLQYDRDYLQVLFDRKSRLCNNYYLKSYCSFGDTCQWDHSSRLTQRELDTLRHKARTSACRNPFCRDPECVLGHMCPRGRNACNINQCKFLPEMHNIDTHEIYMLNTGTNEKTLVRQ